MLNPTWLQTFVALIETGHFTKTAEKLFMTQPGVSQHIAKLEEATQHALIKRDKKSFTITEQGKLVYQYAKDLAQQEQTLIESLSFDDPHSGVCSLACSGAVALLLYPKLLTLQKQHNKLIVKVKAAPNQQILSEIKDEIIDQGIVTDVPNKALFDVVEIGKEELCLIVPKHSHVDSDKKRLLKELGLIAHPDAEHYISIYCAQSDEASLKQLNLAEIPQVGFINQIGQILEPIATGIGFTVIPKSAVDSFSKANMVSVVKSQKPVLETLFLVRKKNRILPARFNIVNDLIKKMWC